MARHRRNDRAIAKARAPSRDAAPPSDAAGGATRLDNEMVDIPHPEIARRTPNPAEALDRTLEGTA